MWRLPPGSLNTPQLLMLPFIANALRRCSSDSARILALARVRQPLESLFNWIEQKTEFSSNGLLVHVFGHLAAAMWLLSQAQSA